MATPAVQTTSTGLSYQGNPDFRGYLAANDSWALPFVGQGSSGNDYTTYGLNSPAADAYAKSQNESQATLGGQIQDLFDTYSGLQGGSTTGNGSSSSSSSSTSNPASAALYGNLASQYSNNNDVLQGEIPTLESNITNKYNTAVSQQNQQEGNEENSNMENRQTTNDSIDSNANSTYNSLMSLLAGNGAGVSGVAQIEAPQAIGQNTATQTNGEVNTYNQNQNQITEGNTSALANLLSQYDADMGNALSGIQTQEASNAQAEQGDLANEAYYGGTPNAQLESSAANTATSSADQIAQIMQQYATPSFTAAAAPTLASYNTPQGGSISSPSASTPTSSGSFLPYLTQAAQSNNNILTGSNSTPAPTTPTTGS